MIPPGVAEAWGWTAAQIAPLPGGLINTTYVVRDETPIDSAPFGGAAPPGKAGLAVAVLQRMHPVFGAEVNDDLDAVTTHLAARGMETPRLLRTLAGDAWFEKQGVWRATTWVDGESVAMIPDPSWAEAGGELVGRFHVAVHDLAYDYKFTRAGVHDTARHLATLRDHCDASRVDEWRDLAHEILAMTIDLPELVEQPHRHVHGDLKISNLLFRRAPLRGVALVDLDTLALGTIAFELGDALRSWCNPHGEDAGRVKFELPIFAATIAGFRRVADAIVSESERAAIAIGLETVCIELASRFCTDVFEDRYFGWDANRFASRRAHNLVRARGQLALAHDVRAAREQMREILLG